MKGEGKNLFVIYLKCIVPFRKFWTMDRIEFSKDRNLSQYTLHHFTREVTINIFFLYSLCLTYQI